jgi:hypothetical protein
VDLGELPVAIDPEQPICLVSANLSFRRPVFDVVGLFDADLGLAKAGIIGSVEDHELLLRVLRTGRTILYDPRITVHAAIQPNRLERAYHRRWHSGHGYFHARLRSEEMEQTRWGTLFGVPAHLYRQALRDLVWWVRSIAIGDLERAFQHELRLRFFRRFFQTRRREFLEGPGHGVGAELWRLLTHRAGHGVAPGLE